MPFPVGSKCVGNKEPRLAFIDHFGGLLGYAAFLVGGPDNVFTFLVNSNCSSGIAGMRP
ncbi:hypothetical protein D3C86_2124180 [compost metagenome]